MQADGQRDLGDGVVRALAHALHGGEEVPRQHAMQLAALAAAPQAGRPVELGEGGVVLAAAVGGEAGPHDGPLSAGGRDPQHDDLAAAAGHRRRLISPGAARARKSQGQGHGHWEEGASRHGPSID